MADENFTDNLLRAIYAQLFFQSGLLAAREMFGKSYFALGVTEKIAVDQAVLGMVAGNFQSTTAESLVSQPDRQPMGFRVPSAAPKQES